MVRKTQAKEQTPRWEMVAGLLGLGMLCLGAGYLIFVGLMSSERPSSIIFETQQIAPVNSGYVVQLKVINQSSTSLTTLTVEGELVPEQGQSQTRSAEIDYLPSGSSRIVGLFFDQDPRTGVLQLRPVGYQEP